MYMEAAQLAVEPNIEVCLPLKDKTDHVSGMITLKDIKLVYKCYPQTSHFTRPFKLHADTEKKCSGFGSCTSEFCDKLDPSSKIPEITGIANDYFGYCYCDQIAGGIFGGCPPWSNEACLLYCIYGLPTNDDTITELFSCIFEPFATLTLQYENFNSPNASFTHLFELSPAKTSAYNGIKLTLATNSKLDVLPPDIHFTSDGRRFAMLKTDLNDHIICATRKQAKLFQCKFAEELAKCRPGVSTENCRFHDNGIESMFADEHLLPIETPYATIYGTTSGIHYEPTKSTSILLNLQLNKLKVATKISKTVCSMKAASVEGCKNCEKGSNLHYLCHAEAAISAIVDCGEEIKFEVTCDPSNKERYKKVPFSISVGVRNCSTICPAGITYFDLDVSQLTEAGHEEIEESLSETARRHWRNFLDINWSELVLNRYALIIGIVIAAFSFIIPLPYLLPIFGQMFLNCFLKCAQKYLDVRVEGHKRKKYDFLNIF
uniref:Phlebovirus glycoprotein G2 fusion domain-containing protein n=1 Tax=Acrobeloides nanus TaxID=290746 RepID=A0A914EN79_9BILA